MQNNLFVVSHIPGKLFSLDTFDFVDNTADLSAFDNTDEAETWEVDRIGLVLKKDGDTFTKVELTEAEREAFNDNEELGKALNAYIIATCTGMIVYDVAWWAMPFNAFMQGFCDRHFDV